MSVQPTKYCADCGAVIAGPDTERHVYVRIKYCRACAAERTLWSKANSQTRHRRDRKEHNRLMREQNDLLRRENATLRQRLATLETMYQEAKGYA